MANPYTGGTESWKLFDYASTTKGNSDKAALRFVDHMRGRGLFDVSGANAVAMANLARAGASGAAHSSR